MVLDAEAPVGEDIRNYLNLHYVGWTLADVRRELEERLHYESAYYDALLKRGVIVRPMGAAGFTDALRITVGLPSENARLLAALAELVG